MAIAVTSLGTAAGKSTSISLAVSASVGDWIVVGFSGDNASLTYLSVTVAEAGAGGGTLKLNRIVQAANTGNVVVDIYIGRVLSAITSKNITATFNTSQAMAIAAYKVSGIDKDISWPSIAGDGSATQMQAAGFTRVVMEFLCAPCTITSATFSLCKSGSPTGTAYARLRLVSDDSLIGTFGSIDVSTLAVHPNFTDYTFNTTSVSNSTTRPVYLSIEYDGGSAGNGVNVELDTTTDFVYFVPKTYTPANGYFGNSTAVTSASGAKILYPVDKTATNTGSGTNPSTGLSGTTSQADEIFIGILGLEDNEVGGSFSTGDTFISGNEQSDNTTGGGAAGNIAVRSAALIASATGSRTASITGSPTADWAGAVITLMAGTTDQTITANGYANTNQFGSPTLIYDQTITANGFANTNAFGNAQLDLQVSPTGFENTQAFGSPTVIPDQAITANGFENTSAFGNAQLDLSLFANGYANTSELGAPVVTPGAVNIAPSGIDNTNAFGTASISQGGGEQSVTANGFANTSEFGLPQLDLFIEPVGIAATQQFGTPTVTPGAVDLQPAGIDSTNAFGSPEVSPGPVDISPSGIDNTQQFGSATLSFELQASSFSNTSEFGTPVITLDVQPGSIANLEAFGTPTVTPGPVDITPSGYANTNEFGSPVVSVGETTIVPNGLENTSEFGNATVTPGDVSIAPSGIDNINEFGTPVVSAGGTVIVANGFENTSEFGTPVITTGSVDIQPVSLVNTNEFGSATVTPGPVNISPSSLENISAFGTPTITSGIVIVPDGINNINEFGNARLDLNVTTSGIDDPDQFGTPTITLYAEPAGFENTSQFGTPSITVSVAPVGLENISAFGTAEIVPGPVEVLPEGIANTQQFGTPTVTITFDITIYPVSLLNTSVFGTPTVAQAEADFAVIDLAGVYRSQLEITATHDPEQSLSGVFADANKNGVVDLEFSASGTFALYTDMERQV